ncbi:MULTISPECIES: hypothetical protein [Pseudomonadota]|uniref:Uncharacterized protein n=1 Tax=Photobacterium damsela subsp. piscicida TaxID=38294 RepID=C5NNG0_PHODP|nr:MULTISPECIES: hypothetical protein [Pseudomonadota]MBU2888099.1 hypothetical protein [Celeribacter halophilus]MBU2952491.1 hypothetical protein [Marinobacter sp. F3R08]MDE1334138.1 hypothetical protein [Vibrio aestuarianus]BAH83636.1 hypothetical protein [Photobacterium damselae subsp. piscicida]GAW47559.1 hypothetical protein PDPJ_5_00012 [Photobacterium damselae subsp. piscicida]
MYKKILVLVLILLPISAFAKWNVTDKVDEFTDTKTKYMTYNDASHNIQISRNLDTGYVWFFITRKDIGSFEPDTLIEMRVDKNKTKEIDPKFLKRLGSGVGQSFYQWEPSTIAFSVWHGKEDQVKKCGFISELLSGSELKIRYRINSLETHSTSVSLNGAKEALISTLELTVCGKS